MNDTMEKRPKYRSLVQSVVRALVPRDERFFEWLEAQAEIGHIAALRLSDLTSENLNEMAADIADLEHQGDEVVNRIEEALAKTFVTPLDREDIQKLSAEFDDVLDNAKRAAYSCVICGIDQPTEAMFSMIRLIGTATGLLYQAVCELRRHGYDRITVLGREVREIESEGDRVFNEAIYALYHDDENDSRRGRAEEKVLKVLEKALNHTKYLANTLIYLAVKHG